MDARPTATLLAEGEHGRVFSVSCRARRADRPYPEIHEAFTIALVGRGSFGYRSSAADGRHVLREGWMIIGAPGTAFECSHDHDGGDECISVVVDRSVVEEVASSVGHDGHGLSVMGPVTRAAAMVERMRRGGAAVDEAVYEVVAGVLGASASARPTPLDDRIANRRRIEAALAAIEAAPHEALSLGGLAAEAGLSRFHFLRLFRAMTGRTPHQYLVGARLRAAAKLLVDTDRSVTRIALDVGFEDVSNFVRTFHREVGRSPRAYRLRA